LIHSFRRVRATIILFAIAVLVWQGLPCNHAQAEDNHAGYYYPALTSIENYHSRTATIADADREMRIQFIVNLTMQLLSKPYPPDFVLFAKGEQAEKMIIVGLSRNGSMSTLYRARAVLAMLTSVARGSRLFNEFGVADTFTFFDLAKLFGFEQITVSDGESYAHQVTIE
jgi:hypothetical protein